MKAASPEVVMRRVRDSALAVAVLAAAGLAASGCNRGANGAEASASTTVQLAPEHVVTASVGAISSGPAISGQLTPARNATVRAQVGGSIVELPVDRGEPVKTGTVLARISSRDLDVAFESSKAAVASAESALAVAAAEYQRTASLVKGGALAARDLEQAKSALSNAEAMLAAARARQTSAWQQVEDTTVRAPFSGVVSERPASLGDVVSPGIELVTVIDPSSLRLEALVPSDQIQQVRPGANVRFSIRGAKGDFVGTVDRVSPSADPITRQVSIFVSVPNTSGQLISGLFADGRVDTTSRKGIIVPLSAVDETGPTPMATRIRDGNAERVAVTLGAKTTETEQVEITAGLSAGDQLIVGSAKNIAAGTPVHVVK
jgi:RND family efflux transporter MFP subunit